MPRRKRSPPLTKAGMKQDRPYPDSTRQRNDKESFLDLPGEVQNSIYFAVLAGTGAYMNKDFIIAIPTNLSLASKQIHAQMVGPAMYSLTARVSDFDFSKLITSLNYLPEEDINLLNSTTNSNATLKVELDLTFNVSDRITTIPSPVMDTIAPLRRWLKRFSIPTKRGSDLNIIYIWKSGHFRTMCSMHRALRSLGRSGILDEIGKVHERRIRDALLLTWRGEHAALAERVEELTYTCNEPGIISFYGSRRSAAIARLRARSCRRCALAADLLDFPPPTTKRTRLR